MSDAESAESAGGAVAGGAHGVGGVVEADAFEEGFAEEEFGEAQWVTY